MDAFCYLRKQWKSKYDCNVVISSLLFSTWLENFYNTGKQADRMRTEQQTSI